MASPNFFYIVPFQEIFLDVPGGMAIIPLSDASSCVPLEALELLDGQSPMDLLAIYLLHMVPTLITKVDSLETELKQTNQTMGKAIVKGSGRIFKDIDDDPLVSFVTPTKPSGEAQEEEISLTTLEAAKTLSKVASQRLKSVDKGKRYKRRKEFKGKDFEDISTGFEEVNIGGLVNTGGLGFSTVLTNILDIGPSGREGKAQMMLKRLKPPKRTKEKFNKNKLSCRSAKRLARNLIGRRNCQTNWDAIRAKLEANAELAKSVIAKDMSEEDFAKRMVDLVNQRKKYFAEERAKAKRNIQKTTKRQKIDDKDAQSTEEKEKEPVNKMGKRRKQIARKGLHTAKDEAEKDEASKEDDSSSGHQFDDAIIAKDELRKAYEECRDIPLEQRVLIEDFLKIESELDHQMQNALFKKAAKIEKN
ncbi:hypothetical protein Tco_0321251 [Tanacetum coccineum]